MQQSKTHGPVDDLGPQKLKEKDSLKFQNLLRLMIHGGREREELQIQKRWSLLEATIKGKEKNLSLKTVATFQVLFQTWKLFLSFFPSCPLLTPNEELAFVLMYSCLCSSWNKMDVFELVQKSVFFTERVKKHSCFFTPVLKSVFSLSLF